MIFYLSNGTNIRPLIPIHCGNGRIRFVNGTFGWVNGAKQELPIELKYQREQSLRRNDRCR